MRAKTVAQISKEKRLRIREIREKIASGQKAENSHLVFKYREQKRIGSLKYREKKKFLLNKYHTMSEDLKMSFKEAYENAVKQREKDNERRRQRRSCVLRDKETEWLDSFDLNDLVLFE